MRAGDRTRTGDVQLGKLAFYQLNYARDVNRKLACNTGRDNRQTPTPLQAAASTHLAGRWREANSMSTAAAA